MRFLSALVLLVAGCDAPERLTWVPIYPLPGETAITSERSFALQAYGVVDHPPCDEPGRLPRARIRDLMTGAWSETHARCASPYVTFTARGGLPGKRDFELHVWLDADDAWAEPVFGTPAARDGDHISFAFSTARRPEILRAVWSGIDTAYLMFSQDIGDDYTPTIDVRGEVAGPEPVPVNWWSEKQWFAACDRLELGCDGDYFNRQHIVIATPPARVPLVVSGTAADGTAFGPLRVEPED